MSELFVGREEDFKEQDRRIVVKDDLEVGVFRVNGAFYAYQNLCAHRGGPVCQGKILNKVEEVLDDDKTSRGLQFSKEHLHIICPWHGFEYNLKDGVNAGNKRFHLKKYEVEVRKGGVYVRI